MSTDYTPEVFMLTDRVAAAFMREDVEGARRLINSERLRWEARGRDQHRRELEVSIDQDAREALKANVYFESRDGLRAVGVIDLGVHGDWPLVWHRACKVKRTGLAEDSLLLEKRELRIYKLTGERAKDGRPIYVEAS